MGAEQIRELHRQFIDCWYKLDRNYTKLLKRWDLSINSLWVLDELTAHPEGVEPAALADKVNMLRQTMTVTLDQLERRGFLFRVPHATDRRRKIITFTPEGQEFAREVLESVAAVEMAAMAELTEEEQKLLLGTSVKFQTAFERIGAMPPDGR